MQPSLLHRSYLFLAGAVALGIGATLLFAPAALHGAHGIDVHANANLASEVRAPGAALFGLGALILGGAFRSALARTATTISALLYLSYGSGRLVSLLVDGAPSPDLLGAMAIEFVLGALALAFLAPRLARAPEVPFPA